MPPDTTDDDAGDPGRDPGATPRPGSLPRQAGMYWNVPSPYGYASAIDVGGTVAAPVLAGFTIALIGIVLPLTKESPVPQAGIALAILITATLSLLASVQCTMWARQYSIKPSELTEWWPELRGGPGYDDFAETRRRQVRDDQWRAVQLMNTWVARMRFTYHLGILLLLAGLGVLLIPRDWTASRAVALAVVGVGLIVELFWSFAPGHATGRLARWAFPTVRDVSVEPGDYEGPPPS